MKALAILLAVVFITENHADTNRLVLSAKFIGELAESARTNHPGMQAAEARVRAAAKGERAISLWDDPEVIFGGIVGNGVMRRDEGDLIYGVDQKLPITGKPQAERARARAERDMEEASREYRFQGLRKDIAQVAFKAALAEEILRISQEDQEWVAMMVVTTGERYKAGRATQVELLRMETEHAARAEQLREAARSRDSQLLALNRLLNRPLETPWPELALPDLAKPLAPSERLFNLTTRFDPRLAVMRREIDVAKAGAESARRAKRPDFMLSVEGRQFAGDGQFKEGAVLLKMSLPWFNGKKYSALYDREKDRAEAATWEANAYTAQVREDLSQLAIRIENARRQALLYKNDIIPRTQQTLTVAQSSWENGKTLFHDVLDARRLLLEGRMNYARAVADQYIALSELVLCCGLGDLESVELYQNAMEAK